MRPLFADFATVKRGHSGSWQVVDATTGRRLYLTRNLLHNRGADDSLAVAYLTDHRGRVWLAFGERPKRGNLKSRVSLRFYSGLGFREQQSFWSHKTKPLIRVLASASLVLAGTWFFIVSSNSNSHSDYSDHQDLKVEAGARARTGEPSTAADCLIKLPKRFSPTIDAPRLRRMILELAVEQNVSISGISESSLGGVSQLMFKTSCAGGVFNSRVTLFQTVDGLEVKDLTLGENTEGQING